MYHVDLTIVIRGGSVFSIGGTELMVHLAGTPFDKVRPSGNGTVVGRGTHADHAVSVARFSLTSEQVEGLISRLAACGLPDDEPRIEGRVDTSDFFTNVSCMVAFDGKRRAFAYQMMSTGATGDHLEAWQDVLRLVATFSPALSDIVAQAS